MPVIRPFQAFRYDFQRYRGDLSSVLAPPYDVLDQADKDALLARDPHNIVAIDLPHIPPKNEGPEQAYLDAKASLDAWLDQHVLVREDQPALYLYHQTFEYGGQRYTRRQFICALHLHDFAEGIVLPHEHTFGGPKADRLALTNATRCNTSPVFGMFADATGAVAGAFAATAQRDSDAVGLLDGVENALWVVTDPQVISAVTSILKDKKVYIADGHHRYTTALTYRAQVRSALGDDIPADHPANYTMIVLASMDDPGCVIQGYNRVLVGDEVNMLNLRQAWAEGTADTSEADADLTLYDGTTKTRHHLRFANRAVLDVLAIDRHPSWRALDIAYLHVYLIDRLAATQLSAPPEVRYVKSLEAALQLAEDVGGVALLPNATSMDQLRAVSEAGELMPQKSTFFFPKVATGLTIHPLHTDG